MSSWCTTLVAGVANCYFAQGLLWLIPVMPHETSHSFIHPRGLADALSQTSRRERDVAGAALWAPAYLACIHATMPKCLLHLLRSFTRAHTHTLCPMDLSCNFLPSPARKLSSCERRTLVVLL